MLYYALLTNILFEICVKHVFSIDMNICGMFHIFVFMNNFLCFICLCFKVFLLTNKCNTALAFVIVHGLLCQHFSYMLAVLHAWMDSGLKALLASFIKQDPF